MVQLLFHGSPQVATTLGLVGLCNMGNTKIENMNDFPVKGIVVVADDMDVFDLDVVAEMVCDAAFVRGPRGDGVMDIGWLFVHATVHDALVEKIIQR
jgi:hypothetical protein